MIPSRPEDTRGRIFWVDVSKTNGLPVSMDRRPDPLTPGVVTALSSIISFLATAKNKDYMGLIRRSSGWSKDRCEGNGIGCVDGSGGRFFGPDDCRSGEGVLESTLKRVKAMSFMMDCSTLVERDLKCVDFN